MFCAMVMHLHRDSGARFDRHAIHLEPLAGIDLVVAPPRSKDLAVNGRFVAALLLELRDQIFDVLHTTLRRHQHGILRLDNDVIAKSDGRDEAARGLQVAAVGVGREHIADRYVVVLISRNRLM